MNVGCSCWSGPSRWGRQEAATFGVRGQHRAVIQVYRRWVQGRWWHKIHSVKSIRCDCWALLGVRFTSILISQYTPAWVARLPGGGHQYVVMLFEMIVVIWENQLSGIKYIHRSIYEGSFRDEYLFYCLYSHMLVGAYLTGVSLWACGYMMMILYGSMLFLWEGPYTCISQG
jgi:hypothetical protein